MQQDTTCVAPGGTVCCYPEKKLQSPALMSNPPAALSISSLRGGSVASYLRAALFVIPHAPAFDLPRLDFCAPEL
jgi:hypothetical protein